MLVEKGILCSIFALVMSTFGSNLDKHVWKLKPVWKFSHAVMSSQINWQDPVVHFNNRAGRKLFPTVLLLVYFETPYTINCVWNLQLCFVFKKMDYSFSGCFCAAIHCCIQRDLSKTVISNFEDICLSILLGIFCFTGSFILKVITQNFASCRWSSKTCCSTSETIIITSQTRHHSSVTSSLLQITCFPRKNIKGNWRGVLLILLRF